MLIKLQPQHLAIFKLELELFAIKPRIVLVDNPVVIGTDDNDVRGVVVLRTSDTGNRRTCRYRNGHSVIQQRPVHRLLQYESFVVIHQSYISFFSCLLLLFFWRGILSSKTMVLLFPSDLFYQSRHDVCVHESVVT